MDFRQMVLLAFAVSIMLTVFGFGLRATFDDLLYLVRRPGLLARSLVSMFLIVPVAAVVLVRVFDLDPRLEIALVALAFSPVPPMLPNKAGKIAEERGYPLGLVATMALLSIIIVPVAMELLGRVFNLDLAMSSSMVASTVIKSVIAPLLAGLLVRRFLPGLAQRIGKPVAIVGGVLLATAVLVVLVSTASALWALVTPPTVLAIIVFVVVGLAAGHLLGGRDPEHAAVLALASATRHPGIALAIAAANFPLERIGVVILLYLLVSAIIGFPFVKWKRSRVVAAADPREGHPGVKAAGGRLKPL